MRITKIWPNPDWYTVWKNIHCTPVPGGTKAVWYKVIHDILPTNVRLHKIRISPTDKCNNCGMHDTIAPHRMWRRTTDLAMDNTETCSHSQDNPNTNTKRMALTSTMCTLASYAATCCLVDTG